MIVNEDVYIPWALAKNVYNARLDNTVFTHEFGDEV
jgi:hypothetical protein